MTDEAEEPSLRADGELDGRGHAPGSVKHRFAPGDGRPRSGRPKGSKSLKTLYRTAADSLVKVDINGQVKRIPAKELLVRRRLERALKGDDRALERFLTKVEQYELAEVEPDRTTALIEEDLILLQSLRERGLLEGGLNTLPLVPNGPDGDDRER